MLLLFFFSHGWVLNTFLLLFHMCAFSLYLNMLATLLLIAFHLLCHFCCRFARCGTKKKEDWFFPFQTLSVFLSQTSPNTCPFLFNKIQRRPPSFRLFLTVLSSRGEAEETFVQAAVQFTLRKCWTVALTDLFWVQQREGSEATELRHLKG